MRVCAFDVVANNADRKSGHVLLAEDRLWAIDNGLCFNTHDKLRTVMPSIMRRRNGLIRFVIARLALVADRSDFFGGGRRETPCCRRPSSGGFAVKDGVDPMLN